MNARIAVLVAGAVLIGACADQTMGPDAWRPPQTVTPPPPASQVAQQLLITPVSLDFGEIAVGETAPAQQVTITNLSHTSLVISGEFSPAGAFGGTENCAGVTLTPGESCSMSYAFTPSTAGTVEATTTGSWNGLGWSVALRGVGVPRPRFSFSATGLDFGQINVGESSEPQTVAVTNLGPGAVTMTGSAGSATGFGVTDDCQGALLAEGASCTMTYQFTPQAEGTSAQTAAGVWNGEAFDIALQGEGMQRRRFAITPAGFNFGEVTVNGFSTLEVVNVTNLGPGSVVMVGSGGVPAAFGGFQNCQGMTLGEGLSCQMFFYFAPTSLGTVTETVTGAWSGQSYAIPLSGTAIAAGTQTRRLLVSATVVDFGQVDVGTLSAVQNVNVTNLGPGAMTLSGSMSTPDMFTGSTNCQGITLDQGQSCVLSYRFAPTAGGAVSATAVGTWNDEPFSITLRGTGMQQERFLITPVAHDFGHVAVGSASAEHVVRVTNLGPGDVTLAGTVAATGPFVNVQDCAGVMLSEGASCEMRYRFEPVAAGETVITAAGTMNGQAFDLSFRGTGVERSRFLISPVGLDFGAVVTGGTAPEQAVLVTNLGPGAVVMAGTGGESSTFGGTNDCQDVMLAEGASCRMLYSFAPTDVGPVTETTAGSWNGQAFAVTLHGTGVAPAQATIGIGGFLPPLNRRATVQAGSTLPVRAWLTGLDGRILPDADAAALGDACAVTVILSIDPASARCARYTADGRTFQVELQIPRLVPTGAHQIILQVAAEGGVVATATTEIQVRGR
jgi:hypothetical protein